MSPSFGYGKGGKLYRYYVATSLQTGRSLGPGRGVARIAAPALEAFILASVQRLMRRQDLQLDRLAASMQRLQVGEDSVELVFDVTGVSECGHRDFVLGDIQQRLRPLERVAWEGGDQPLLRLRLPGGASRGGRTWFDGAAAGGSNCRPNPALVRALKSTHGDLVELNLSPLMSGPSSIAASAPISYHARRLSQLAFLAPDLQRMILEGKQPARLNLRAMLTGELPLAWEDQRAWFSRLAAAQ